MDPGFFSLEYKPKSANLGLKFSVQSSLFCFSVCDLFSGFVWVSSSWCGFSKVERDSVWLRVCLKGFRIESLRGLCLEGKLAGFLVYRARVAGVENRFVRFFMEPWDGGKAVNGGSGVRGWVSGQMSMISARYLSSGGFEAVESGSRHGQVCGWVGWRRLARVWCRQRRLGLIWGSLKLGFPLGFRLGFG